MVHRICVGDDNYYFDGESLQLYKDFYCPGEDKAVKIAKSDGCVDKVTIYVSEACNGRCAYCYEEKGAAVMDKGAADRTVEYLTKRFNKIGMLSFFGGEPLLNFDIIRYLVNQLEDKVAVDSFQIVTNGVLLNEMYSEFFISHKFEIIVSFDGPELIHDILRPGCSHTSVLKAIERIQNSSIKDKLSVNCTYTQYHENTIGYDKVRAYFEGLGIKYHLTRVFTDIEWLKLPEMTMSLAKKDIEDTFVNLAQGSLLAIENPYVCSVINALVKHEYSDVFCSELDNGLAFDVNGLHYPCTGLIHKKIAIENVIRENRKDNEVCNQCWAKGFCFHCPAGVLLNTDKQPFSVQPCMKLELYAYTLDRLVEIFHFNSETFQSIIDNFYM